MAKRRLPSKDFWLKALPRIIKRGRANARERKLAMDFNSCAVVEACATVGRDVVTVRGACGTPLDPALADLGYGFYYQLRDDDVRGAAATYAAIQGLVRTLQLKRKFGI